MKLEMFCLCEAANESHGRLNLLGVFDKIYTKSLPAVHPRMVAVARMRHQETADSTHRVVLTIVPPSEHEPVAELEVNAQFKKAGPEGWSVSQLILAIERLRLDEEGSYTVQLSMDGEPMSMIPLFVQKLSVDS
ncbi:MAG: hypothetical protein IT430_11810 [Phycisphaerales bacterium]|nr:hypothetical protein [Phycisphaerales bacterium]